MILYAATSNAGKLAEFAASARAHNLDVRTLPNLASMPEPVEDAPNFMGNAERKALAYSRLAPGLLVLADDSGLEVQALSGDPGVRSARFADDLGFEINAGISRDERNNRCVLSLLQDVNAATGGRAGRHARFVCALAAAQEGRILYRAESSLEGEMLEGPRGSNGFGYDPLFLVPRLGRSLAELDQEEKWSVSHRGNAFRDLLEQLQKPR